MLTYNKVFSPSYSTIIAPHTFKVDNGKSQVDMINFSTAEGNASIEAGFLVSHDASTLEDLKSDENLDTMPLFKWDGMQMWSSTNILNDELMIRNMLDDIFIQTFFEGKFNTPNLRLLDVPYEGWYARQ